MHTVRALALGALLILTARAAEPAKKSYDMPAGEAAVRLKQFSETSGRETLFAAEAVRGVRTAAVKGEFTPKEALDHMLDGTGLVAVQDEKTGALAVRRDASPNAPRAAQTSDRPSDRSRIEDGKLVLDTYHVAGLRDSGLVNEGVVPREEKQAIAFTVIDRQEIERSGATDINEVLRTIPQIAFFQADTQSLVAQTRFGAAGAGVTASTRVDMRGFGNQGTTVLVNGRRMSLTRELEGGTPDLSRIPLSAIERIEVLPSSAGGLYGTNTMGGVINIILKKNYLGRELTVGYGQAAAGGANEYSLTYTEGRTLFGGKANLTWTFDARKREPMYYGDRPIYRGYLERNVSPTNGGSLINWITSGGMLNFVPRPGVIVGGSLSFAGGTPVALNIPGGPAGVFYASIPANQNGTGLTPASFIATANQLTISEPYARLALFNPSESASLNITYNHELKKDRLYWYAELGLGHTEFIYNNPSNPQFRALTATDPRNPFRAGVVPGYPGQAITIFYHPTDLPGTQVESQNSTVRLVLGMNGQVPVFGRDWKWAVDTTTDFNRRFAFGWTPMQTLQTKVQSAATVASGNFYNMFADHDAFPNTAAAAVMLGSSYRKNIDYVWQTEVTLRASGELFDLPAGPMQASLVAEGREQSVEVIGANDFDHQLIAQIGAVDQARQASVTVTARQVAQAGGELVLPVLGRNFTLLGIHRADLVAGYSYNHITDAEPYSTSNLGVRFSPVRDLTFRVSYGQGTFPPQELRTLGSTFTDVVGSTTQDPRRGNTGIGNYTQLSGGNPDLKPEQTQTWNFGLILEPRQLKGFSATFDYGFIEKQDGIQTLPTSTLLANEAFYPGRVTRATPTAGDTALGWAGQITQIDARPVNVGNIWTQYLDTSVRYNLKTATAGDFYIIFRGTNTREFKTRLRPESPVIDTLDQQNFPLKFKGSGTVSWRKGAWTVTPGFNYIESYRDDANIGVEDSLTYNLQLAYEVKAAAAGNTGWRRWTAGTQWTVGCNNVADSWPPFVNSGITTAGGRAYYSTYDDPRGRYFYLRLKKNF